MKEDTKEKTQENRLDFSDFFEQKKDKEITKFKSQFTIHLLEKPMKDLKLKGFKEALGEAIRYLFYVNLAIVNNEVERTESFFESSTSMFKTLSPTFLSMSSSFGGMNDFKGGLAFTMVNLFIDVYRNLQKEKQKQAAQKVVDAFVGTYGKIDVDKLEEVVKHMALRYEWQIAKMTISISTNGKLRMSERDGVVAFANVIAKRIGSHLMKDGNLYITEDKKTQSVLLQGLDNLGHNLKVNYHTFFGEAQNVKARIKCPLLARCIFATWQEIDGYEDQIEFDATENASYLTWPAGTILTQTGICIINKPNLVSYRKDYYEPKLGYIRATESECTQRSFVLPLIDMKAQSNNTTPKDKSTPVINQSK